MIPFSRWLPKAIAAPTPVSALVHSRTLVTAGIVLLTKIPVFFDYLFVKIIFLLGFVTMTLAGAIALFEVDMKKVVALSTLSQLGFMMVSFRFGLVRLMMIHLFMHALFKSFLFFNVGVIINLERIQDVRRMSFSTAFISTSVKVYISFSLISLMGLMFTSGMVSKEFIVESNLV
jgi:NADH-ubiquinone oxidoreductase chain 5